MMEVKNRESINDVSIIGTLSQMEISEKSSTVNGEKREFIIGKLVIKVDQEVDGKIVENEIPVDAIANKLKSDGSPNAIYKSIQSWKDNFVSLAAADKPTDASRVSINGKLGENIWIDTSGIARTNVFQVKTNFLNKVKSADEEDRAEFELTGVIGEIKDETDKDGNDTGRIIIQFIVVGWNGKVDVINLIAESPAAVNHIRQNYNKGDTVGVSGIIRMTTKEIITEEEQGFGPAKKRKKTTYTKELIITSGSHSGFDDDDAYDPDSVKVALVERKEGIEKRIAKSKEKNKPSSTKKVDLGF